MTQTELLQHYEGALEPWKAQLALNRIKAMGFPRQDWPDLMQELAMLILEFQYDPQHEKAATERTALYAAINNFLLWQLRNRYRSCEEFVRYLRDHGIHNDGSYVGPGFYCAFDYALTMDIKETLPGLSDFDRAVALGLAEGMSKSQLSRHLDCQWNTVQKAIRRIRQQFKSLGILPEGLL